MRTFKTFDRAIEDIEDGSIEHQITWYIERRLTLDEWIALDDAMDFAFEAAGVSLDDVIGVAGPIPFDE